MNEHKKAANRMQEEILSYVNGQGKRNLRQCVVYYWKLVRKIQTETLFFPLNSFRENPTPDFAVAAIWHYSCRIQQLRTMHACIFLVIIRQ